MVRHTMVHGQDSESPCPLGADRWRGTHLRELARTAGVYLGREYGATALKKHVHIPQIRQDPELNSERHNKQAKVPGGRPRTRSTMAHKWYTTRKYTDIYLTPRLGARNTNCAKH